MCQKKTFSIDESFHWSRRFMLWLSNVRINIYFLLVFFFHLYAWKCVNLYHWNSNFVLLFVFLKWILNMRIHKNSICFHFIRVRVAFQSLSTSYWKIFFFFSNFTFAGSFSSGACFLHGTCHILFLFYAAVYFIAFRWMLFFLFLFHEMWSSTKAMFFIMKKYK